MKNKFYVFEGADGSGKTTQIELFVEGLSSEDVYQCSWSSARRIYGKSPLETIIKEFSPESVSMICDLCNSGFYSEEESKIIVKGIYQSDPNIRMAYFFSLALAINNSDVVLPSLRGGKTVICDRYVGSTLAYQGLKKRASGESYISETASILKEVFSALGESMIDQTCIYVFVDDEKVRMSRLMSRGQQLDSLDKDLELQERLHMSYLDVFRNHKGFLGMKKVIPLDNSKDPNTASSLLLKKLNAQDIAF